MAYTGKLGLFGEVGIADVSEYVAEDGRVVTVKSVEDGVRAALAAYHSGTMRDESESDSDPYYRMLDEVDGDCQSAHLTLGFDTFHNSGFSPPGRLVFDLRWLTLGNYGQTNLKNIHADLREVSQTDAGGRMGMTPEMAERIIADYPLQKAGVK